MPKLNRRSFMQKCLGVFGAAALSPLVVPWFKFKRKPDRVGESTPKTASGIFGMYGDPWKTYSSSIIIDDKMPPGYVDFVNFKMLKVQKELSKELGRSLYGS